jgi:hypothetical protein
MAGGRIKDESGKHDTVKAVQLYWGEYELTIRWDDKGGFLERYYQREVHTNCRETF